MVSLRAVGLLPFRTVFWRIVGNTIVASSRVLFGVLLPDILCEWLHYRASAERLHHGHTKHLSKFRLPSLPVVFRQVTIMTIALISITLTSITSISGIHNKKNIASITSIILILLVLLPSITSITGTSNTSIADITIIAVITILAMITI